uniref:preprotein translocase subunit SecA n=1 Tax=Vacuolaria virescens TaxID=44451 RepID=UPI00211579B5|nr:preprotein translocase subunit SecA [Vacuolaria virescens]UTE94712.1 preprotein translocase subunit SecA [Vacuolaria virescens]
MFNFLANEKNLIKKYQPLLNHINIFENNVKNFTDDLLKEQIWKLKKKYLLNQKLSEDIVIESFALTREAAVRTIGLRHFDQQILGGLVLNDGKIAEMKTGEGKTLVATLPAVTNGLTQNGVHLVTVNDYLAKRDVEWMGKIYHFLGLSVGLVQSEMQFSERKKSYKKDITYITNSELGFDYLRDNMTFSVDQIVQRPFNYCIIDEIDSILIDEARTPLIISGEVPTNPNIYIQASQISKYLKKNEDFEVNEKTTNINLTEKGIRRIEKILGIINLFEAQQPWSVYVVNALRAEIFFLRNVQYIIKDNKIIIVDEFTGRMMPERRWNNGLHESVEAKENIPVKKSSEQLAAITYQNFFIMYPKLSGMTGTAKTAEAELEKIYNLEVLVIPTARPFQREDLTDRVYINEISKWKAVAKECALLYKIGRPVLVGTNSIEKSEVVSVLLNDYEVPHKVLNAKPENLKLESEIIAEAGCRNSITISTNMSGRGTDIILGGSLSFKMKKLSKILILTKKFPINNKNPFSFFILKKFIENIRENEKNLSLEKLELFLNLDSFSTKKNKKIKKFLTILFFYLKIYCKKSYIKERTYIQELGGLFVIGTERHESRRIDNQLRGRAGRQGDLGSSRFFISLEDKTFRLFGGKNIEKIINTFELQNDELPLESKLLGRSLDLAQEKVENYYYEMRKQIYDYDEVLNQQRRAFYFNRSYVLKTSIVRNWVICFGEFLLFEIVIYLKDPKSQKNIEALENDLINLKKLLGFSFNFDIQMIKKISHVLLFNFLREQFWLVCDLKEISCNSINQSFYTEFEKTCLLEAIDFCWSEHLQKMTDLRDSIGWTVYAQRDPLVEYKYEGYRIFIMTLKQIMNYLIVAILSTNVV